MLVCVCVCVSVCVCVLVSVYVCSQASRSRATLSCDSSYLFMVLVLDISSLCFHTNLKMQFFPNLERKRRYFSQLDLYGYRSQKGEKNHCEDSYSGFDLLWQVIYVCKERIGPRTEPCRTPEETGTSSELMPLITTVCFRLSK